MTIEEYQEQAIRTCANLDTKNDDLLHMDLGIITEAAEILDVFKKKLAYGKEMDIVNVGEEIADIAWYVANKTTIHGMKLSTVQMKAAYKEFFADHVKEAIEDNEEYDFAQALVMLIIGTTSNRSKEKEHHLFNSPIALMASLAALCAIFNLDFEEQLEKNINKLKVRYRDKFDSEKAINRDLVAERKTLEE